jgi:hypothetical protein
VHWGGAGGSFGVIDRRTGVSAGYAMNNLIFTAGRSRASTGSGRTWVKGYAP